MIKTQKWLQQVFAIDLRSLAAFRISLGLVVLLDIIERARYLRAHYTDFGVLPRSELSGSIFEYSFSFFLISSNIWIQISLVIVMIFLALALVCGFRTRWASVLLWLFVVSIQNRNHLVLQAGDVLLRMTLFWAIFLPLARCWSIDQILNPGRSPSSSQATASPATAALIIQVFSIYFFTAILKTGDEWWPQLTASMIALQLDQFATPLGIWLRNFGGLIKVSTAFVLALEWVGPFLLLLPIFKGRLRGVIALCFMVMHLCFALTMELGLFPFIDIATLLIFIPARFWDKISIYSQPSDPVQVFFDGNCGFCRRMIRVLEKIHLIPADKSQAAQTNLEALALMHKHDSWVIQTSSGEWHVGFVAFVVLCKKNRWYRWLGYMLNWQPLIFIGESCYRWIADHRGSLSVLIPPRLRVKYWLQYLGWLGSILLISLCIWWNVSSIARWNIDFPKTLKPFLWSLRLDQRWNMFAPFPLKKSGWLVFDGQLVNGTSVDPFLQVTKDVTFKKPSLVSATYQNQRWRKYLMNLSKKRFRSQRLQFARFLCRRWNRQTDEHGKKLSTFTIYLMSQTIRVDKKDDAKRRLLWKHNCFG